MQTVSFSPGISQKAILKKALLFCGIASSLFYIVMNIAAAMQYSGYNIASQTVSELSAVDAPTRSLWIFMGVIYTLLLVAFGWGVWKFHPHRSPIRISGGLMIIYAILGIFWPPMHQREVLAAGGGTLTDTLHIVWTIATVILMLAVILFAAAGFGKQFRIYSIITIITLLIFGLLTGLESPKMEANLPTPWIGVLERICIGAYMLWIIILAIALLRQGKINQTI